MTLDRANRSFLAFTGIGGLIGALVLCGALGAVLIPLVMARVSHGEFRGSPSSFLLPAFAFVVSIAVGLGLGGRMLARQMAASRRLSGRVRALAMTVPAELNGAASSFRWWVGPCSPLRSLHQCPASAGRQRFTT